MVRCIVVGEGQRVEMIQRTARRCTVLLLATSLAWSCSSDRTRIVFDSTPPTTVAATVPTTPAISTTTSATSTTSSAPAAVATTTIDAATTTLPPLTPENAPLVKVNGTPTYLYGANLPWFNFGSDFGGGAFGGGASSPEVSAAVDAALAGAHQAGMNAVRWWLFPGSPTQFTLDAGGLPTGLEPSVYADIDAALELATRNQIGYVFTLFSGPTALPVPWLTTEVGRGRLAAALGGLFAKYGSDPRIVTWDVINEPEFDIWSNKSRADDVRALIRQITAAAHAVSTIPVTVGGARLDGLPLFTGLGLDYYTVHWYDAMTAPGQCLPCASYAQVRDSFHIDLPIVIGEFYAGPDVPGRFERFRLLGYAGGLAWSLLPDRTMDHLVIDLAAAAASAGTLTVA